MCWNYFLMSDFLSLPPAVVVVENSRHSEVVKQTAMMHRNIVQNTIIFQEI